MGYIGREPTNSGEFLLIDNISGDFDGSESSFTLKVGTSKIMPAAANTVIALDGVLQEPSSSYSISGSTITFTAAPESTVSFYGVLAGQSQYITNYSITDDHISLTANISGSKINTNFGAQSFQLTAITASANVSGSSTSTGSFGRLELSASLSASATSTGSFGAIYAGGMTNSNLVDVSSSFSSRVNLLEGSGSITESSASFSTRVTTEEGNVDSLQTNSGSFSTRVTVTEASGALLDGDGTATFSDITVTGTITAQQIQSEFVSASITLATGSNIFGDDISDSHQFTGSILQSGSFTINKGSLQVEGKITGSSTTTGSFGSLRVSSPQTLTVDNTGTVSGSATSTGSFGQLHITSVDSAANPTLNFGDGNTGFYEESDNVLGISIAGSLKYYIEATSINSSTAQGGMMKSGAGTLTTPVFTFRGDENTGVGWSAADKLSLIAGGVGVEVTSTGISGSSSSTGSFGDGRFSNRVGIGNVAPSAKLMVDDNTDAGYSTKIRQDHATGYGLYVETQGTTTGDPALNVKSNDGSNQLFWVDNDGKVGIGTTAPVRILSVSSGLAKTNTATGYPFAIQSNESSNQACLNIYTVGGASAAVRKFQFQTTEAGVANSGIIEFQPDGGDVRFPNGILFGSDTAAANELDDYEEGTWTAQLTTDNDNGGKKLTVNTSFNTGYYTKVGNICTIQGQFKISNVDATPGGDMHFTGLPFTSAAASEGTAHAAGAVYIKALSSAVVGTITGFSVENATDFYVRAGGQDDSGEDIAALVDTGTEFIIGCTYRTA